MHLSKVASGFGWTSISTIVNGLAQVLRLSILSRFLTKEDFGVVTIITLLLGLTHVFSDLGFSAAIMSEKDLKRNSFNGIFWAQLFFYLLLIILVSLSAPVLASYYHQPILNYLIPLSLLELLFLGIGKLYDTILQKQLRFKLIAIRNVIGATCSLIIAVILAVLGFGAYSLVISTVLHAAILHSWNFIIGSREYPITFRHIDFSESKSLMKVGFYQMGTQIVDYFASKIDILIISNYLGLEILGVYNLVKELVLKFIMVINTIVNRVMLPTFSAQFTSIEYLKNSFLRFIEKLSLVNFPIIGFIFVFRYNLINIFYGSQYTDATQVFGIMSIWSLFVVLGNPNGMIAIITKNTKISFEYTIVRFFIMLLVVYLVGRYSLVDAALSMLIVYMIMFFVNWKILLNRILNISLIEYLGCFIVFLLCVSFISLACDFLVLNDYLNIHNSFLICLIYGLLYFFLIFIFLYLLKKNQLYELLNTLFLRNR